MQTYKELYIGGEWVAPDGSDVIEVISPATEEVIGQVPHASTGDADRAVAAARKAFDDGPWPHLSPVERAEAIARLSAALQGRAQDLADTISSENGSPKQWSIMGQVFSATSGPIWVESSRGSPTFSAPSALPSASTTSA